MPEKDFLIAEIVKKLQKCSFSALLFVYYYLSHE